MMCTLTAEEKAQEATEERKWINEYSAKRGMRTLWVVTNSYCETGSGELWNEDVTVKRSWHRGRMQKALVDGTIECYTHPLVATYLNYSWSHGDMFLWKVAALEPWHPVSWQGRFKVGCERVMPLEIVGESYGYNRHPLMPVITTEQRTRMALLCARSVADIPHYSRWMDWSAKWLSGEDRTYQAADAVRAIKEPAPAPSDTTGEREAAELIGDLVSMGTMNAVYYTTCALRQFSQYTHACKTATDSEYGTLFSDQQVIGLLEEAVGETQEPIVRRDNAQNN